MSISNYINDLLYRYDCVIVPDFGGFVTNRASAQIENDRLNPPSKQVSFNGQLTHNDGLLVNYIASAEKISFADAADQVAHAVGQWKQTLEEDALILDPIGTLSRQKEGQLLFEPNTRSNYLTDSFGLQAVSFPKIARVELKEQAASIPSIPVQKRSNGYLRYAAAAAIALTLGTLGWNYQNQQEQKELLVQQQRAVEEKIQTATFVIDNPLPTIEWTVDNISSHQYFIIAGAFQFQENAAKKVEQLTSKGFKARILGKNAWGLTQVCYESFANKETAYKRLEDIRAHHSNEAWMYIKKAK